ncbi:VOC family protein [Zunongwangia sp. F260]|uniref:VOC family protein n=1 Tax=Autumnicola lenta TaxID=3075593 RepID=A0ABU3CPD4_9FLAO|nr:VOC family protein [Zunongwangia sp. F260]MDT0647800.1 VOC family protein [Zunongwangia sp. F260]
MKDDYKVPAQTRIGHIHLKVSNIDNSLTFYHDLLGFEITERMGDQAVFLSAGGYHHHIALNTWNSKDAPHAAKKGVGLFHTAIVYPSRKDLAEVLKRLLEVDYPLTGVADHGVSEALYMDDPDGNGVELYWDRPRQEWPKKPDGSVKMYTHNLDLQDLLAELEK